MVFVRPRSRPGSPAGGVRHRARRRIRRVTQSAAATPSCRAGELRRPSGPVPHRREGSRMRTHVRRDRANGRVDARQGAPSPAANTMTNTTTWTQRRAMSWIEAYQRAFAGRPSPCRFYPTCSNYAHEAFEVHGTARGGWLTLRRLVRCRPFGPSGFDPVPDSVSDSVPSVCCGTPGDDLLITPPTREVD